MSSSLLAAKEEAERLRKMSQPGAGANAAAEQTPPGANPTGANPGANAAAGANPTGANAAAQSPQYSNEELIAEIKKRGLAAVVEPDSAAIQQELEKARVTKWVDSGRDIEEYAKVKKVAELKEEGVTNYAKEAFIAELIEDGFSPEDAQDEFVNRFYIDDPSETRRKRGQKELAAYAAERIRLASSEIAEIDKDIERNQLAQKALLEWPTRVSAAVGTVPQEIVVEIDKQPYNFVVDDQTKQEIAEKMLDPAELKNQFFDEEGRLNLNRVAELLLKEQIGDKLFKHGYNTGHSNATEGLSGVFASAPVFGQPSGQVGAGTAVKSAQERAQKRGESLLLRRTV